MKKNLREIKTSIIRGLPRDIPESKEGKKNKSRPRLEYFIQFMKIISSIWRGTLSEVKELSWDKVERRRAVTSNQSSKI